ncbi:MAG: glycosyltransferase family 2 protein [Alphaproteobacteria bacterium]|nr:glycosyltransferase family 2 protein [Alphaproteobacteria bacterium]
MTSTKRIAAITMARNDEFFLSRWIEYYGSQIGNENLYIILDGIDQEIPTNAGNANITKLPHVDMSRAAGDKYRIGKISDMAKRLFNDGYDLVIGCDTDEFLIVDPAINKTLSEYLSEINIKTSVSGLGLDIGQNMNTEQQLNIDKPMLEQRGFALLSTRYTKPVVLNQPVRWGSGFHHVHGHSFHIDENLYLLHFGAVDMQMLLTKAARRGPDWVNHLRRRGNGTINDVTRRIAHGENYIHIARIMQRIFRPIYAIGKPGMLGIKWVVKIPVRFKKCQI